MKRILAVLFYSLWAIGASAAASKTGPDAPRRPQAAAIDSDRAERNIDATNIEAPEAVFEAPNFEAVDATAADPVEERPAVPAAGDTVVAYRGEAKWTYYNDDGTESPRSTD